MEHSPGPWEAHYETLAYAIYGADGDEIALLGFCPSPSELEQAKANARLVASAPELYEAVKGFLEWAEKGGPLFPKEQMERALAKAEGREDHHA